MLSFGEYRRCSHEVQDQMPQSGTQMSKNQLCYTCKLLLFHERVKCKASKSKSFLGYLKGQGHQRSFKLFPSILDFD